MKLKNEIDFPLCKDCELSKVSFSERLRFPTTCLICQADYLAKQKEKKHGNKKTKR